MSAGEFMLQILPLGLLLLFVGVVVWHGTAPAPDDGKNKSDIGGGPGDGGVPD